MKVEELSSYNTAFDHLPLRAQILQMKVMFSELKKEIGLFGIAGFIRQVNVKQKQLKKQYGKIVNKRFANVPSSAIISCKKFTLSIKRIRISFNKITLGV